MHFPYRRLAEESRKGITKNNIFSVTTTERFLFFQINVLHGSAPHPLDPQQGIGGCTRDIKKYRRQTKTPA
jgi:hypothetical protein